MITAQRVNGAKVDSFQHTSCLGGGEVRSTLYYARSLFRINASGMVSDISAQFVFCVCKWVGMYVCALCVSREQAVAEVKVVKTIGCVIVLTNCLFLSGRSTLQRWPFLLNSRTDCASAPPTSIQGHGTFGAPLSWLAQHKGRRKRINSCGLPETQSHGSCVWFAFQTTRFAWSICPAISTV